MAGESRCRAVCVYGGGSLFVCFSIILSRVCVEDTISSVAGAGRHVSMSSRRIDPLAVVGGK